MFIKLYGLKDRTKQNKHVLSPHVGRGVRRCEITTKVQSFWPQALHLPPSMHAGGRPLKPRDKKHWARCALKS